MPRHLAVRPHDRAPRDTSPRPNQFDWIKELCQLADHDLRDFVKPGGCLRVNNLPGRGRPVDRFLHNRPRIPPSDYDIHSAQFIIHPSLTNVQSSLLTVFETWFSEASEVIKTQAGKSYECLRGSHFKLTGPHDRSYYFAHLALCEAEKNLPSIVFETILIDASLPDGEPGNGWIDDRAVHWFEGSDGAVQLVIHARVSHDSLSQWSPPSAVPSTSGTKDWGLSPDEIRSSSVDDIARHIHRRDTDDGSPTKVDIRLLTPSYPAHLQHSELAWHGKFRADGMLLPSDHESTASDFNLCQLFPDVSEVAALKGGADGPLGGPLYLPVSALKTSLNNAVWKDHLAQAQHVASTAMKTARDMES